MTTQIQLYLARHAHAEDDAESDELRPLSLKGHRQMQRLVDGLDGKELLLPEVIWQSGLLRAAETAAALHQSLFPKIPIAKKSGLAPEDDPAPLLPQINRLEASCLVVGHEPNLSRLASLLLAGDDSFERVVFAKASILCLSRLKIGSQSTPWQIEWHLNHAFFK